MIKLDPVYVRMSIKDKDRLREVAEKQGQSLSSLSRKYIFEGLRKDERRLSKYEDNSE